MFCFAKICRLCLNDSNVYIDIFKNERDSKSILEKLIFLRPDLISSSDDLPSWICSACRTHINRSFNLVKKWTKSHSVLQKYKRQLTSKNNVPTSTILSVELETFNLDKIDYNEQIKNSTTVDIGINNNIIDNNSSIVDDSKPVEYFSTDIIENDDTILDELLEIVTETQNITLQQNEMNSKQSEMNFSTIDNTLNSEESNILERAIQIANISDNVEDISLPLTPASEESMTENFSQILKSYLDCLPTTIDDSSTQSSYSNLNEIPENSSTFCTNNIEHINNDSVYNNNQNCAINTLYSPYFNNETRPFCDYQNDLNYTSNNSWSYYNLQNVDRNVQDTNNCYNNSNLSSVPYNMRNYTFDFSSTQYTPPISPNIGGMSSFVFPKQTNNEPINQKLVKRPKVNNKDNTFFQVFQDMEIASRHCNTPIQFVVNSQNELIIFKVDKNKASYCCETCNITYEKLNEILDHCLVHIPPQDLTENEYLSINIENPEKSVKLVVNHETKKFVCRKCDKNFSEFAALYRHVAVHVSNQRYFCDECGKSFPVYRYLSLHKLTHSRIKVYACKSCPKTFRAKESLKTHEIVHHEDNQNKPFICDICGKGFIVEQYLKIHLKRHNNESGSICHICGVTLKNEDLCYKHIKEKHLSLTSKQCEICQKTFHANRNLKAHMKLHGSKDHKCDQCDKEFFFKRDLQNHYLIHTGVRPHVCQHCSKDFRSSGALRKHIKTHFRVHPFVCRVCQKGFSQQNSLQVHEKMHFGQNPFKCLKCGKSYVKNKVLQQHIKKVHPEGLVS